MGKFIMANRPVSAEVLQLEGLISTLPEKDREFASSLTQAARKYASGDTSKPLTNNQEYWVGRMIRRALGTEGGKGKQERPRQPEAPTPPTPLPVPPVDIDAIVARVKREIPTFDPKMVADQVLGMSDLLSREIVVRALKALDERVPRRIEVVTPDKKKLDLKLTHRQFEEVLKIVSCDIPTCLVGPAGSGKTTVCEQIAHSLSLKFYFSGQMTGAHELTGFVDANGRYQTTPFREAFEKGGLFLCDEVDGSDPSVPNTLNAALANGQMSFPDKAAPVARHSNFRCVAAANTYGRGADRVYVGRNQLDGAFLDRFVFVAFDYDTVLEIAMSGNPDWARRVQRVRAGVEAEKARVIVSPRASIYGAKLLASGMKADFVEDVAIWKGIDPEMRRRIEARSTPTYATVQARA